MSFAKKHGVKNVIHSQRNWGSATHEMMKISDPLYNFVDSKLKIKPVIVYLLILIVPLSLEMAYCYYNKCLFSSSSSIGLLNDYANFANYILLYPSLLALYLWLPKGITQVFESLRANGIIPVPDTSKALSAYNQISSVFKSKWWFYIVIFASFMILLAVVAPVTRNFNTSWIQKSPFYISDLVIGAFVWYALFFSIVRVVQFVIVLKVLFAYIQIDLKALHPDGCGGLRALGEFSMMLGYVIGAVGIAVVFIMFQITSNQGGPSWTIVWSTPVLLIFLAYILVALMAFFAPLNTAHNAMLEAKEREQLIIANKFEGNWKEILTTLSKEKTSIKNELDMLEQLKRFHEIIRAFPVWPFNYENILRFGGSVISPILLTVISTLINFILK